MKKTAISLIIFAIALIPVASVFGQKIDFFELNMGGPASRLTTLKIKVDLIEEIAQVKDSDEQPLSLYEAWVRILNKEEDKAEKYLKVFTLEDTAGVFGSLLQSGTSSVEGEMVVEVIPLTPLIIDEVLVPQYLKILSTKGEDTKANIRILRRELEVMMDKNYLLVRRITPSSGPIGPTVPQINLSAGQAEESF